MMRKGFLLGAILGLMVCMTGCHTAGHTSERYSENVATTDEDSPRILFLQGVISFDSTANAYHIRIDKQEQFPGKINIGIAKDTRQPKGLNYMQLDANDRLTCNGEEIDARELTLRVKEFVGNRLLNRHEMDNPLIQRMEYADGEEFKMKTIIKKEADLFLRLQLNGKARKLRFCNNEETIETIIVE